MTYKSAHTGRTEIAAYIFLETETEENVRDGVKAWKCLMPYNESEVGGVIYIGVVNISLKMQFFLSCCHSYKQNLNKISLTFDVYFNGTML